MAKKRVSGFTYLLSNELKQEIAFSHKTGFVYCEDKGPDGKPVTYNLAELIILKNAGMIVTQAIHNVKSVLGGTIVEARPNSPGKQDQESVTSRRNDIQNPGEEIPGFNGNVPHERPGELEIF
jgi:hypothetical protein